MVLNPVELAHTLVKEHMPAGEQAVDATAGNGHDTSFLARLVGPEGRVTSFDVQGKALETTRERLERENLADRVLLVHQGHQRLRDYVSPPVAAVMFNLGYLPGGDHWLTTRPGTTLEGIKQSLEILTPGGLLTVVEYPGHGGGEEEARAVETWLGGLPRQQFSVWRWHCINPRGKPPRLVAVKREETAP